MEDDLHQSCNAKDKLSRLCRYYADCLIFDDDSGVSIPLGGASDKDGYIKLDEFPGSSEELSSDPIFRTLFHKVCSDIYRLTMYLGWPIYIAHGKDKYEMQPLLLFPITIKGLRVEFKRENFIVNRDAFKSMTRLSGEKLSEYFMELEKELEGMANIEEVVEKIRTLFPNDPNSEKKKWMDGMSLRACKGGDEDTPREPGMYNRVVVLSTERSKYTRGLTHELEKLPDKDISGTALKGFLCGFPEAEDETVADPLLEISPMNLEQREAVRSSLTRPLTVVTGPPGTGKSQVITNIIANAAWQGKNVLFASKNHKAVEVVEERIKSISTRPALLRLRELREGYYNRLAEYLEELLRAAEGDRETYKEDISSLNEAMEGLKKLGEETSKLIELRNKTDELEREVEILRSDLFARAEGLNIDAIRSQIKAFRRTLSRANRSEQALITRTLWSRQKKRRLEAASEFVHVINQAAAGIGVSPFSPSVAEDNLQQWKDFLDGLELRLKDMERIKEYWTSLRQLQSCKPLEDLAEEYTRENRRIVVRSEHIWESLLKLRYKKIDKEDAANVEKYRKYVHSLKDRAEKGIDEKLEGEYRKLHKKVFQFLPCWSITSLSAKGRIPFKPRFFDIVIFDEASQCDIASALPLLCRAKSAVVIGDNKQLRHISKIGKAQDDRLMQKHKIGKDLEDWRYSEKSLFDLADACRKGGELLNLINHYRSHADIIEFSNQEFYDGRLIVNTPYEILNPPHEEDLGVEWIDCKGVVRVPSTGSALNSGEVEEIVATLQRLIFQKNYQGSIGVVTPFKEQAKAIRNAINKDQDLEARLNSSHDLLVETIHNFQGDERDIMIFSPVLSVSPSLSKGLHWGGLFFYKGSPNLFNVAITRARSKLIVIGNLSDCADCEVNYLARFAEYCKELRDRPKRVSPTAERDCQYPAVRNPDQVSDWERILYRALCEAGIHPIRVQYLVDKYLLDFALNPEETRRLNIEVDGERYHKTYTGEHCRRDRIRDQRLINLGWDVMRFWVYEVRDCLPECVEKVRSWLEQEDERRT